MPLGGISSLTIRDPRQEESALTMSSLRRARFPFRMLDEVVIAPQKMQANFIPGNLIVTFVSHHQVWT